MEDRDIVALYFERDESAIRCTEKKYGRRLRTLSFGIVQDMQTAEECENDTYMNTWNSIPPHEPKDHFFAYLAKIVRNLSLSRCRERSCLKRSAYILELSAELEQCIAAPDDCEARIDDMALRDAINGFLAMLSAEKRNIFLRRYWYLDSIADISKRFALSESKVKTTLFRSRNQLREYLEKEGYTL